MERRSEKLSTKQLSTKPKQSPKLRTHRGHTEDNFEVVFLFYLCLSAATPPVKLLLLLLLPKVLPQLLQNVVVSPHSPTPK